MAGISITEKILAAHSENGEAKPGEIINASLDLVMGHDVTTPPAISLLEAKGIDAVFDAEKVVLVQDHFVPNKDIKSAELANRLRNFARKHKIKNYFDIGNHGVCHALLPEQGLVLPGMTIAGADSHTCTYGALGAFSTGIGSTDLAASIATGKLWFKVPGSQKFVLEGSLQKGVYSKDAILSIIGKIGASGSLYNAMEFSGKLVDSLSIEARMTITNMAIEAGAKSGIIAADKKTKEYLKEKADKKFTVYNSDSDAKYSGTFEFDFSSLEPLVACPSLPSNIKKAKELSNVGVDQAYLGSCTNGRIEDLRIAAKMLKGNKVAKTTRMIVVPATTEIWKQANREGLLDIFMEAGATVSTPTCGACLGGHMGILAKGEKCISSTNRNFTGRMGSPESEVYLASPATVAASAIAGKITDPRDYL